MAKLRHLLPEEFETYEQVSAWHLRLVRDLERIHPDHPALSRFKACGKDKWCCLEGCPRCRRRLRRQLVSETHRLGFDDEVWTLVTVIPTRWKIPGGALAWEDPHRFVARTVAAIDRSVLLRGLVIIGSIDVSWEVHGNGNGNGHWQLHLRLLVRAATTPELNLAFQSAFRPEPSSDRPYDFEQCAPGDFCEVLTYVYKNEFEGMRTGLGRGAIIESRGGTATLSLSRGCNQERSPNGFFSAALQVA